MCCAAQALGEELGADGAKRLALAATAGLDNAEDWLVSGRRGSGCLTCGTCGSAGRQFRHTV